MVLARIDGTPLSKAYKPYVVEGGRPITQFKNFIWKTIHPLHLYAGTTGYWKNEEMPTLRGHFSEVSSRGDLSKALNRVKKE